MDGLVIKPVENKKMLKQFIRVPWSIYDNDPAWVPPLIIERIQFLSPGNPYFAHARFHSWVACRDGRPVGRISAQIDQLHLDRYEDNTGFFGMIEAEDNADTFRQLMETAEAWLRERGMRRIRGPFNLSTNHECGLLVEGFDTPPMFMMGHARPYFGENIEQQGYVKAKDLLAYIGPVDFNYPPAMDAVIQKYRNRIRVRFFDFSRLQDELAILKDVFEDAWSDNWGFLPFTEEELNHMGRDFKQVVPGEFVAIAELDGQPAAIILVMPNINEAIRDLNGRLLPLGWLKLIWRLKVALPKTVRVALMGVRKQLHKRRIGAAVALTLIRRVHAEALKRGCTQVEMSWILEDNVGMRNMIESIGGRVYKRYRIYEKNLKHSPSGHTDSGEKD